MQTALKGIREVQDAKKKASEALDDTMGKPSTRPLTEASWSIGKKAYGYPLQPSQEYTLEDKNHEGEKPEKRKRLGANDDMIDKTVPDVEDHPHSTPNTSSWLY